MKILVTGAGGQLGRDVVRALMLEPENIINGVTSADFDITDKMATERYITEFTPDAVVHCAAYTAVDKAEDDAERCFAVNDAGTENIAGAVRQIDGKMLYVSTDYVFDGSGTQPREPDCETGPLNVYGESKLRGEKTAARLLNRCFIVRTSWVFGSNGGNFVKTMLRLGGEGRDVSVVDDQVGSPTYTADLAALISRMIKTDKYGIYHAVNSGYCSWYDFTREIFRQAGISAAVHPVPSGEYPVKAKRPLNSRLSCNGLISAGFEPLPAWQDALGRFLREISPDGAP